MRGGRREGAGRRPKIDERAAIMSELAARLRATPAARRRAVIALAAFGADDAVIEATLNGSVAKFAGELAIGRAIAGGNLVNLLFRKAATGNVAAI